MERFENAALYRIPPKALDRFPGAQRVKGKTLFAGGIRARWKDIGTGTIYEWDYQHGHVEVYDHRGHHHGGFDASTGQQVSEADNTRRVEP